MGIDSQFVNNNEQDVKLDSPNVNKNVKDRFKSYSKSKQSNFKVSIKDYNLRNENNILSNLANQKISEAAKRRTFRDIPLQLKALMGSEYGFTKNNLYAQGDAMKDSTIKDIIKTCFLSLAKVQYLEEYNGDNLKNHVWRDMTSYSFNSLIVRGKKTVLCKIVPFESNSLKVEADFFDRVGIENQYFFISPRSNRETITPTIIRKPAPNASEEGPQAVNDDNEPSTGALQIMQNFIAQAPTLNDTTPPAACKTLVITQPNSKDGPLRDVDYKVTSGLTGVATGGTSPSPRPMTGTTMTTAPAVATTPTMSPAAAAALLVEVHTNVFKEGKVFDLSKDDFKIAIGKNLINKNGKFVEDKSSEKMKFKYLSPTYENSDNYFVKRQTIQYDQSMDQEGF